MKFLIFNCLGNDVIYQMSLNSLNELIQKNQNLSSFLNDIFAPSSKSVDRLLLVRRLETLYQTSCFSLLICCRYIEPQQLSTPLY